MGNSMSQRHPRRPRYNDPFKARSRKATNKENNPPDPLRDMWVNAPIREDKPNYDKEPG